MATPRLTFTAALAAACLSVGMLAGCNGDADKTATPGQQEAKAGIQQHFRGTAPCSDCSGAYRDITLNFTQDGQPDGFTLTENYMGAKDGGANHSFNAKGLFAVLTGSSEDPKAVVYHLMPDDNDQPATYYQRTDDNTLKLLDKKGSGESIELTLSKTGIALTRAAQ